MDCVPRISRAQVYQLWQYVYCVGFTEPVSKFWRQISKGVGGVLLKPTLTFSRLMFLIDAIKLNVDCIGEGCQGEFKIKLVMFET